MPAFRRMSLSQLTLYCSPLHQAHASAEQGAWRELCRRAVNEQNPAAWDALLMRLWPSVLYWIYSRRPDLAPATAERFAQQILTEFKRRQTVIAALPSHERLVADLQQLVERLLLGPFA